MPGDYDGDGLADVAVYRPSTGFWYLRNQPSRAVWRYRRRPGACGLQRRWHDGHCRLSAVDGLLVRPESDGRAVRRAGTVPVPGDYNGDSMTDFAVFDTATGTWDVRGQFSFVFGDGTDTPVPGDYDGDGTTDIAVYRPSTGTWDVLNQFTIVFGDPGDVPVVRTGGIQ